MVGFRVCLLDATYKTTKYDIPLFFLVVRANECYLVVGIFFIQVENTASIKEALDIFKAQNPDWNPVSWVTDFSEPEIWAIKGTFPMSRVYLCLFHRKQAWQWWLSKKNNLDVPGDSEQILKLWEEIVESPSEEQFLTAKQNLQSHELLTRNSGALDYFNKQWLSVSESWVKAYEDKENFFSNVTTTNGVESLNKSVKHFFLDILQI
ncbi:uncharacterized protein LOC126482194 [Schistocerca serialis cubense]|uniref:uncharacterized protein LOC126482194 n=1 Tax=Schistocerca serialis cubense TaxID=2023355 RepID=UPI00214F2F86|nr:uncharacterized protein LOC126482194 [Schistocerca serialis cubense]